MRRLLAVLAVALASPAQAAISMVFAGDSITAGIGACSISTDSQTWPAQAMSLSWFAAQPGAVRHMAATSGWTTTDLISDYATRVGSYKPAGAITDAYLFVFIGTNDLHLNSAATIRTNLRSYWATARADGFKVVAFTVRDNGQAWGWNVEAARATLNGYIRADSAYWDYLVDDDATAPFLTYSDTSISCDGTHLTLAGLAAFASVTNAAMVAKTATSVTLGGQSYALQPHPRVWLNPTIDARSKDPDGAGASLAPKAVVGNPAWVALGSKAADYAAAYSPANLNHTSAFTDGSLAALYAQYWYADNSRTAYHDAALALLNGIEKYVPLVCNEAVKDCVNGGNGYYAGSYGPAYWMPNWIYAFELMRGEMTAPQRQAFADKFLNDKTAWGGIGGTPASSCTNPTVVGAISVSVDGSGNATAASPLFGGGQAIQVGDWIAQSNADNLTVIATVTDSTHAKIASNDTSSWSGYSGTLFSRRSAWQAGDCGWFWLTKHDWYTPSAIIGASLYPSGGANGGSDGAGVFNLTLSATHGMLASLLSLADDDQNFASRTSSQLTALYDWWYTTAFQGLNQQNYTGFTPTGSVYGLWRGYFQWPATAYSVVNSVASPPDLLSGVWAKNIAHHFYLTTFPSCPAEEMEYGQTFGVNSAANERMPNALGMPLLIAMYSTDTEGKRLNYWMRNLWAVCSAPSGNVPGTNLLWNSAGLASHGLSNPAQSWFFLYTDPAHATDASLPTGAVDNTVDAGASGKPLSGMTSRTGYASITDTLVSFYSFWGIASDHDIPAGGFNPGDYRIFKAGWLLGGDSTTHNAGGPRSMALEIGGANNIASGYPFIAKMPRGKVDASKRFTYAMTDTTQSYTGSAAATRVHRHLVHFTKPGAQDFVVVYDDAASSSGKLKRNYLHYSQKASTSRAGSAITSSFAGTGHSDAAQLLTQVLAPAGSNSVYVYQDNVDGTYSGGDGNSYRVSVCASANGSSCDATNTAAEFAVVHMPVAGSGNSLPATAMLATVDADHRAVQVGSAAVAVFPKAGATYTGATFTSTHTGTAQYLVTGLTAGTYSATVDGASVVAGAMVADGDNSLYFESTAGAVVVTQTGTSSPFSSSILSAASLAAAMTSAVPRCGAFLGVH